MRNVSGMGVSIIESPWVSERLAIGQLTPYTELNYLKHAITGNTDIDSSTPDLLISKVPKAS